MLSWRSSVPSWSPVKRRPMRPAVLRGRRPSISQEAIRLFRGQGSACDVSVSRQAAQTIAPCCARCRPRRWQTCTLPSGIGGNLRLFVSLQRVSVLVPLSTPASSQSAITTMRLHMSAIVSCTADDRVSSSPMDGSVLDFCMLYDRRGGA